MDEAMCGNVVHCRLIKKIMKTFLFSLLRAVEVPAAVYRALLLCSVAQASGQYPNKKFHLCAHSPAALN